MKTSLPVGQGDFLTGTRKDLSWAKARAEGIAGQGRSFSPLKSLQNPIGKAELHH